MDRKEGKDTQQAGKADSRPVCRYGARCYQKHPDHQKKFRHPARNNAKNANDDNSSKKRKTPDNRQSSTTELPKTKKQNVSTDSEDVPHSKEENNSKMETADIGETEKPTISKEKENVTGTTEKEKAAPGSKDKEKAKENAAVPKDKETAVVPKENAGDSKENAGNSKEKENAVDSIEKENAVDSKEKESAVNSKVNTKDTIKKENATDTKKTDNANDTKAKIIETNVKQKITSNEDKAKDEDQYSEAKKLINKVFLVNMPNDFYKFYDFCNELKPSDPATAFKIADIKLVGPYDVLNGIITSKTPDPENLLNHWRYYYDPPEFQTILKGNDKEGLHFGYWRDRPSSDPAFVATNCCNVSHKIKPVAENVFGAVTSYLEERAKKANPFEKTGFFNLLGKLKVYANTHNINLETQSAKMKSREKNVVARTIHGAGVVCPYNKKSQLGYRELSVTDNQLLKIVKKIDDSRSEEEKESARAELGEVVRLATIAGDECDFGTCLELGHDLLSTGCVHVQNAALVAFSIAYEQLERRAFLKIVEAHMKNRKKGSNLSALPVATKECLNNLF